LAAAGESHDFQVRPGPFPLELSRSDGMVVADLRDEPLMTDETDKTAGKSRDKRQDRLKSALRENLKRRKTQARERAATAGSLHDEDDESARHEETAGKAGD
jgi:hypothetical protein